MRDDGFSVYGKTLRYTALSHTDLADTLFLMGQNILSYTDLCSWNLRLHNFEIIYSFEYSVPQGLTVLDISRESISKQDQKLLQTPFCMLALIYVLSHSLPYMSHHSKMPKNGQAKYIQKFSFDANMTLSLTGEHQETRMKTPNMCPFEKSLKLFSE